MKENYTINFMISIIIPEIDNITLINGDYNGYIFNMKNKTKEVNIIENDKRYVFTFINTDYFTDEYINQLIETITIE